MSIYLDDVAFWVEEWRERGDFIPESIARKIAEFRQGEDDTLAAFARGEYVDGDALRDDVAGAISYAKTAGFFEDTINELYALKDWVLHQESMGI